MGGPVTRKYGKNLILPLRIPVYNKPSIFVAWGYDGSGKAGKGYGPASREIAQIPMIAGWLVKSWHPHGWIFDSEGMPGVACQSSAVSASIRFRIGRFQ